MSDGLSDRLSKLVLDGRRLNDDSSSSESVLTEAMNEIIPYAKDCVETMGGSLQWTKSISLFECQEYFKKIGEPDISNKKVSMKPDGGILIATISGNKYPMLIVEDKVQGTNDLLHAQGKKRQATGNAIERGAKNIRGAEMLFAEMEIFPYVLFASGCDFHSSETIAKRIEMMNMGIPNHYIEIGEKTCDADVEKSIDAIIPKIDITKRYGKSIASVFVKGHKWNEMKHGSSAWKKAEIIRICKKVVDLAVIALKRI